MKAKLFAIGSVSYLLGGAFVKYCPYPDVWWLGNLANDFGTGLLSIIGITSTGKIKQILALLAEPEKEALNPSPEAKRIE